MSSTELDVDLGVLRQVAGALDAAGRSLFDAAADLDQRPDAGASSGEVARTLAGLSAAVAGLGQHLGTLSTSTTLTGADYAATDRVVADTMARRREVGP